MAQTHANGMAVAVIDGGKVSHVQAYGIPQQPSEIR